MGSSDCYDGFVIYLQDSGGIARIRAGFEGGVLS